MTRLLWLAGATICLGACGEKESDEERLAREIRAVFGDGVQVTVSAPQRRITVYLEGSAFTGLSDSLMNAMGREVGAFALERYPGAGEIDSVNARFIVNGRGEARLPQVLRFPAAELRAVGPDAVPSPTP